MMLFISKSHQLCGVILTSVIIQSCHARDASAEMARDLWSALQLARFEYTCSGQSTLSLTNGAPGTVFSLGQFLTRIKFPDGENRKSGMTAEVLLAEKGNKKFAIKIKKTIYDGCYCNLDSSCSDDIPQIDIDFGKECARLRQMQISHPNITCPVAVSTCNSIVVLEYGGASVYSMLRRRKFVSPVQIVAMIRQVYSAVQYLSENGMEYYDLHSQNILCNENLNVFKITDLGDDVPSDRDRAKRDYTFRKVLRDIRKATEGNPRIRLFFNQPEWKKFKKVLTKGIRPAQDILNWIPKLNSALSRV